MDSMTLLGIALALAMDAFAVAAAVSAALPSLTTGHIIRLSWHFGLFQAVMPVIGWCLGASLLRVMGGIDHWIAFGLLFFLGLRMIWESRHPETRSQHYDPTRGWSLVGLSVATSIDALAVGISLALVKVSIAVASITIGMVALIMTFIGTKIGRRAGSYVGQWAERAGGIVLIAIAFNILLKH